MPYGVISQSAFIGRHFNTRSDFGSRAIECRDGTQWTGGSGNPMGPRDLQVIKAWDRMARQFSRLDVACTLAKYSAIQ